MKFATIVQIVLLLGVQPGSVQAQTSAEIAQLLVDFPGARFFWQQHEIARRLVALGDAAVVPSIELYLDTPDRRRRCNAALVLAGFGDPRGTRILIDELQDTSIERLVTDGGGAITGMPTPESMARQQMRADRYFAALLLGELRSKEAVPALVTATRDPAINDRAATSLGEIGDPSAAPALREMISSFPEQRVWAGYALAAFGEPDGFDVLEDVALTDPVWVNRRYAVDLLGKTGDSLAVPILLSALRDEHPNVRVTTVQALGRIGDPTALPALQERLKDDEATQVNAPTNVAAEARKAIAAITERAR